MFLTKTDKINSLYKLIISNTNLEDEKFAYTYELLTIIIPGFDDIPDEDKEELIFSVLQEFEDYTEEA